MLATTFTVEKSPVSLVTPSTAIAASPEGA
jgi:hypothetical protein